MKNKGASQPAIPSSGTENSGVRQHQVQKQSQVASSGTSKRMVWLKEGEEQGKGWQEMMLEKQVGLCR